jgi:hypothetical protein
MCLKTETLSNFSPAGCGNSVFFLAALPAVIVHASLIIADWQSAKH